jgi:hypothetical protein
MKPMSHTVLTFTGVNQKKFLYNNTTTTLGAFTTYRKLEIYHTTTTIFTNVILFVSGLPTRFNEIC